MAAPNLLAVLPALLSGKANIDDLAKQLGMTKRTLTVSELERGLGSLCEAAVAPGVEVIEVTGKLGAGRFRCILVTEEKNLLQSS